MRRREFIAGLGGAAAWPIAARAQRRTSAVPVVGYVHFYPRDEYFLTAYRAGLAETGYAEGRNVAIEYRFANSDVDRLREFAADLIRRHVAVIVAPFSLQFILPAAQTTTTPILFMTADDPVQSGFVDSYDRPGGNATGLAHMGVELEPKRYELLHELVPAASHIAVLINPLSPLADPLAHQARVAAAAIGAQVELLHASTAREIDAAFANVAQNRTGALLVSPDIFFLIRRVQLTTLATHYNCPAIYFDRTFVEFGGLVSYGPSFADQYRQLGIYTGRILMGTKPADLPVMQPTRFELVVNTQTARTLGIEMPPTLLALADEVIE
jgi:putative tryptophan/tyrosine transport system substrate-binding protein